MAAGKQTRLRGVAGRGARGGPGSSDGAWDGGIGAGVAAEIAAMRHDPPVCYCTAGIVPTVGDNPQRRRGARVRHWHHTICKVIDYNQRNGSY